jgi:hypothetical protein
MALNRVAPGVRMGDFRSLQDAIGGLQNIDASGALTAKAGGGQTGATQLINGVNEVTTVASAADSVQLPPAIAGAIVPVANSGAESMTVYGKEGRTDTIDGTAGATGVAQASGADNLYFCARTGFWRKI